VNHSVGNHFFPSRDSNQRLKKSRIMLWGQKEGTKEKDSGENTTPPQSQGKRGVTEKWDQQYILHLTAWGRGKAIEPLSGEGGGNGGSQEAAFTSWRRGSGQPARRRLAVEVQKGRN